MSRMTTKPDRFANSRPRLLVAGKTLDNLIDLVNKAAEDSQKYADATVVTEPPAYADALYQSTHELIHYLQQRLVAVDPDPE